MKKYLVIICFVFFKNAHSQNLVQNWNFEDTITCASLISTDQLPCFPWFSGSLSPDYYSSTYTPFCNSTPIHWAGYQFPRSGSAYCGFAFYEINANAREYLEVALIDSLKNNHHYCVSFYLSQANKWKYSTDDIGAYFSPDTIFSNNGQNIQVIPQVINTQGNILNDTLNWMLVSGEFIAQGGEKYITIGNFNNDVNTTLDSISNATISEGYYYIDDISVTDCTVGIEEIKNEQIKFILSPNPVWDKLILKFDGSKIKAEKYEIINSLGELVLQTTIFNLKNNQVEINVNALPRGIYFLKLLTDSGYATAKFVKE